MKTKKCTPIEERWAQAYACKGMTKADAWRAVHPTKQASDQVAYSSGCRFSQRPAVMARVQELLSDMAVDSIVSGQAVIRMMLDDREAALAAGLPGAAISGTEKLMRHKALMTDRMEVSSGPQHNEEIIKALANGDPHRERLARELLGSDTEFAPLDPAEPEPE